MRYLIITLSLVSLMVFVSCGQSDSGAGVVDTSTAAANNDPGESGNVTTQNETATPDGSNINGIYGTVLYPINYNIHFKKLGTASVQRDGDSFTAKVDLKYGPREVKVKQAIFTGRRCPTVNDDLNKDAYVDINEALIAIGYVSIPLDGSLDSQAAGLGNFPVADSVNGTYTYNQTASFSRMFSDLKTPDLDTTDNIIKLKDGEGLTFPGRIVLLQGIPDKVFLPTTATTVPGQTVYESMPLACGVLWKMDALPTL
jgi:hypothetical protein